MFSKVFYISLFIANIDEIDSDSYRALQVLFYSLLKNLKMKQKDSEFVLICI